MTPIARIALAGNPNAGKTTAFNRFTGSRQHVGNYPGITVEKKEGTAYHEGGPVQIIDLPGTYSLTAYSIEELVARNVLADERPDCVLNVVNAGVLERNLYLTVQLLEMGVPLVVMLNMMDEALKQGVAIDIDKLSKGLGVPVTATVARVGEGLQESLDAAVQVAAKTQGHPWKPLELSYGPDIDNALLDIVPVLSKIPALGDKYPVRWLALKVLEGDSEIFERIGAVAPEVVAFLRETVASLTEHLAKTLHTYPEALIAEYRYGFITTVLRSGATSGMDALQNRIAYSDTMDRLLTGKVAGPIILVILMYLMYWTTFALGEYPAGWLEEGIGFVRDMADNALPESLFKSLLLSGVIDGVGGVLGFVPLIAIMFFIIAFLEDSGYMARVAYMMDRVFRFFGLHGASVMPFIVAGGIAGGCAVPGVMAARTLRSPRERLATILTAPFMTCGAKVPVFLLFVGIFFEEHQALVMLLLTLTGWAAALLVARVLRSTLIRGEATPFVMELPPYRWPLLSGMLIHTWERAWMYIKKAGTIILAISILLWVAMTFPSLPDDRVEEFDKRAAVWEETFLLSDTGKLESALAEVNEQLAELPQGDAARAGLEGKVQQLEKQLDSTQARRLERRETELVVEIEGLEPSPESLDVAQKLLDTYTAVQENREDAGEDDARLTPLNVALKEVQGKIQASPVASRKFALVQVQEELAAMPEVQAKEALAAIEHERAVEALRWTVAGRVGTSVEGISSLAGFDWRVNIALVAGIAAKEVIVSTLGTAYSLGEVDAEEAAPLAARIAADPNWNTANALALLLFTLLYSPCFVTLAVIKNETGTWGWSIFSLVFNLVFAFAVAVGVYQLLS